jgi:hypothetical protein
VVEVLWWLVPPLVATVLAMLWVGYAGRDRDDVRRDDSEEALVRMEKALTRPGPRTLRSVSPSTPERTHGVAVRRSPSKPESRAGSSR